MPDGWRVRSKDEEKDFLFCEEWSGGQHEAERLVGFLTFRTRVF